MYRPGLMKDHNGALPQNEVVGYFRHSIINGVDWPVALFESMAQWSTPLEIYNGVSYNYFIGGEAFDWLTLAQRICNEAMDLLPIIETELLLAKGRLPESIPRRLIRNILGVQKYRGFLNFYYGVTVEEALLLAVELEDIKRLTSNGVHYEDDWSENAFLKIYGSSRPALLETYWSERYDIKGMALSVQEYKEFTYWLFKHRLSKSDKAKIASDTRKGLKQLEILRVADAARYKSLMGQ